MGYAQVCPSLFGHEQNWPDLGHINQNSIQMLLPAFFGFKLQQPSPVIEIQNTKPCYSDKVSQCW